jgi:hypothetical protein
MRHNDDIALFSKHTPGPWTHDFKLSNGFIPFGTVDSDRGAICFVTLQSEEVQANTRLIAAAPELLEALKSYIATMSPNSVEADEKWLIAKAAIAKAEGTV